MPAFSTTGVGVVALYPGDSKAVIDNEDPDVSAVPFSSLQVALGQPAGQDLYGFAVDYTTSGSVTNFEMLVQVNNFDEDIDANYQTIDTLSSTSGGHSDYGGVFAKRVRLQLTENDGDEVTAIITR